MNKILLAAIFIIINHGIAVALVLTDEGGNSLTDETYTVLTDDAGGVPQQIITVGTGGEYSDVETALTGEALGPGDEIRLISNVVEPDNCYWATDSGDSTAPITLNLNGYTWSFVGGAASILILVSDYITITGPGSIVHDSDSNAVGLNDGHSNVTVSGVAFSFTPDVLIYSAGIKITGTTNNVLNDIIERCSFETTVSQAGKSVDIVGPVNTVQIRNCYTSSDMLIVFVLDGTVYGSPAAITIYNNVSYNYSSNGIRVEADATASGCTAYNNIWYGDGSCTGISDVDTTSVVNSNYNCFYNNSLNTSGGTEIGSNSIISNPLFINASSQNFKLQTNSPCIDAGNKSIYNGMPSITDYYGIRITNPDGNLVTKCKQISMGASQRNNKTLNNICTPLLNSQID